MAHPTGESESSAGTRHEYHETTKERGATILIPTSMVDSMRQYLAGSSGKVRSSPCPSYPGCITGTRGYDYRKGQGIFAREALTPSAGWQR